MTTIPAEYLPRPGETNGEYAARLPVGTRVKRKCYTADTQGFVKLPSGEWDDWGLQSQFQDWPVDDESYGIVVLSVPPPAERPATAVTLPRIPPVFIGNNSINICPATLYAILEAWMHEHISGGPYKVTSATFGSGNSNTLMIEFQDAARRPAPAE